MIWCTFALVSNMLAFGNCVKGSPMSNLQRHNSRGSQVEFSLAAGPLAQHQGNHQIAAVKRLRDTQASGCQNHCPCWQDPWRISRHPEAQQCVAPRCLL